MFKRTKKCELCKAEINSGMEAEVEVYGRVGKFKKNFCSEEHLEIYKKRTEALMKTRRTCMSCNLR